MIRISFFTEKEKEPTTKDLKKALGDTFPYWEELVKFTKSVYPAATEQWKFWSAKYGWGFRVSDKKRAIIYLGPRDKHFIVSFVFGQKATDQVMKADLADIIKTELMNSKIYMEGRGISLEIKNKSLVKDIKELVRIKVAN